MINHHKQNDKKDHLRLEIEQNIYQFVQQQRQTKNSKFKGNLCLHAKQLQIFHPLTKLPMIFEADTPF